MRNRDRRCRRVCGRRHELRIRQYADLRHIQTFKLHRLGDTVANQVANNLEEHMERNERECNANSSADNLRDELAGAAGIEEPAHSTGDAVQPLSVSSVSKQSYGQNPPGAVDAVNTNRTD